MVKVFEDYFSELQSDMVAVCLEYVNHKADHIYIYCFYEPNVYVFDVFFNIYGQVVHKHQLNKIIYNSYNDHVIYDDSRERKREVLGISYINLHINHKKCEEFNREMPTEIKIYYDVTQKSLRAEYKYELIYSNDDTLLPEHIFDQWYEEVKNEVEK